MITHQEVPILEYDDNREALIRAWNYLKELLPERCVISFFGNEVREKAEREKWPLLGKLKSEVVDLPIYEVQAEGERLCVAIAFCGGPGAAVTLEELHALGCQKFIVCGGAGCIVPGSKLGALMLPTAAVRDEGTSFHYLPPAREVPCGEAALRAVREGLREMGVPFVEGKTWTTDAIYRETPDRIALRREEGCLTVEMEAAAFFAVAEFYGLTLAQILYGGDDVSGSEWDSRGWNRQKSVRENLLDTAIRLALRL